MTVNILAPDLHSSTPPLVAPPVWLLESRPIFSARIGTLPCPPPSPIISLYSAPTLRPTRLVYLWPFLPDASSSCLCSGDAVHLAGPRATALAGISARGPAHREHLSPTSPWHFLPLSRSQVPPGPPPAAVPPALWGGGFASQLPALLRCPAAREKLQECPQERPVTFQPGEPCRRGSRCQGYDRGRARDGIWKLPGERTQAAATVSPPWPPSRGRAECSQAVLLEERPS